MNICSSKVLIVVWVVILIVTGRPVCSQGLVFSSFEQVQEKRTSLNLSDKEPWCLDGDFGMSFQFSFYPDKQVYYGYLLRMVNQHGQNIDLIYNNQNQQFNIVSGGNYMDLSFTIDSSLLFRKWNTCALEYKDQTLSLFINGRSCGGRQLALRDHCFLISFGASQLPNFKSSDLPPMKLKDVSLHHGSKQYAFWPLKEVDGNLAIDSIGGKKALVTNPIWETPLHQRWQLLQTVTVKGNGSYTFNPLEEEVYMVGSDSIHRFLLRDRSLSADGLSKPVFLARGFQSIYNPADKTLYSIHIDKREITAFLFGAKKWDQQIDSLEVTQYWQSNKFINQRENALYVLGGYGQLKYKNLVQRCSFNDRKWEEVKVQQQDYKPRYLAALGTKAGGDTAYILGGYGSNTGEQMLNPRYYYDLLMFDVKNREIKKIYTLMEPEEPFVFASSMVIDTSDNSYYALIFPNDRFRSALQLIKGSLHEPTYQPAADTIPYAFADNLSSADLFYCARSNQLLAITQLTAKDRSTEVRIYSLAFPPQQLQEGATAATSAAGWYNRPRYLLIIALIGVAVALFVFLRKYLIRKPLPAITKLPDEPAVPALPTVNTVPVKPVAPVAEQWQDPKEGKAILTLFGEFTVRDKDSNALTHLFSPLIKEMFLLIVIHTARTGKGISTEKLYEVLWYDKSERDARNNRSVNMVKLKGILEKLGTGVIQREDGKWKFVYDPALLWVDLMEFYALSKSNNLTTNELHTLLNILKEGTFLFRTEYLWLEDIKSEVSSQVLDILLREIGQLPGNASPDTFIEIANAIFVFDPIHEDALRWKCRNLIQLNRLTLAKSVYEKFCKDYRHIYGESFNTSFQEIIS
ncbi:two-component SAPR family response regulator [Chitinophaga terrae (ex Kim and Jung 2007)]|uniref:hypothetical protein n=1 Tax=Chitinophaga terrae (ex Kim and Jung 2007) TaxID=408074 RepID=UPI0027806075|nr:hypothetical protein [Chitinophaga terrae (ex Kim and Jung 2007)]MDQ0108830.1 two-component SAPR family response regulator [Chitinophaga terrae (ex Kim and Jung 2007)]